MSILSDNALSAAPSFDSFIDRVDAVSVKLLKVINSLRLQADLVGMDEFRQVTLDADTLSIAIDDIADNLDDTRRSVLALKHDGAHTPAM